MRYNDMAKKSATYQLLNSVAGMLKSCNVRVYLLDRPKEVPSKLNEFAVVDLPLALRRPYVGNDDFRYSTTCVIYLFCRAKNDGTPNIEAQSTLVRKVFECFPYTDSVCECVHPEVLMRGADEFGFQMMTVTFTLRTRINSITNIQ